MEHATAAPDGQLADDVARWCEMAEQQAMVDVFAATQTAIDDTAGARSGIAGGIQPLVAVTSVDLAFFNRVVGLGVGAPASEALLDDALAFYGTLDQQHVAISLAPGARPSELPAWIEARGFVVKSRWAKCWRETDDVPSMPTDLRIERIGPGAADAFASVVIAAFGMPPQVTSMARAIVGRQGWTVYLGYDEERPVSAAALYVNDGVAWLGFGATLEEARGRGGQSAMFARRLADARDLGCRLAITETGEDSPEDPNPSFHNMIRLGFRVAYLRQNWVRG